MIKFVQVNITLRSRIVIMYVTIFLKVVFVNKGVDQKFVEIYTCECQDVIALKGAPTGLLVA